MELLVIIITLALIFDYINGFHDAANSIATIVSTKVLTPFQAVIWAAFFNFVAFFVGPDPPEWREDASVAYFKDKLYYLGGWITDRVDVRRSNESP